MTDSKAQNQTLRHRTFQYFVKKITHWIRGTAYWSGLMVQCLKYRLCCEDCDYCKCIFSLQFLTPEMIMWTCNKWTVTKISKVVCYKHHVHGFVTIYGVRVYGAGKSLRKMNLKHYWVALSDQVQWNLDSKLKAYCVVAFIMFEYWPVKIRVRIGPLHPLASRKRWLNGAVLRMRPEKRRSCVTAGVAQ
jgi:hypothetical protein